MIGRVELVLVVGILLLSLVIAGVIALALLLRQSRNHSRQGNSEQPTVRQILDERLARGEIDEQEYDRLRARIDLPDDKTSEGENQT